MFAVPATLTYEEIHEHLIEEREYRFICQATDGNPGSVIKWYVNGKPNEDGILPQVNETNTQTSTFVLTADRTHNSIQCMADQVDNKESVWATVIHLNVSCECYCK